MSDAADHAPANDGGDDADVDAVDPATVEIDDPNAYAQDALEDAFDAIDAAADADPLSRIEAADGATDAFTTAVAEADLAGLPKSRWSMYCAALADECDTATKTSLAETVERKAATPDGPGGGTYPSVYTFIENNTVKIDAIRSTDAKQSTIYSWVIEIDGERFNIETGTDTGTSHYEWRALRSAIFDVSGRWTSEPPQNVADNWVDFIGPFISEHQTEVDTKGPRSCAVEALQNHIRRSVAYPTIEDMVDHNGVRIDDDPDDGDPEEIWVDNREVTRICDDHEVSPRALQIELDARGHTVARLGGVSESTFVYGTKVTYWVLDAGVADPKEYETDPETPTERFERQSEERTRDDAGGRDGDESGPADDERDGDDDGGTTGLLRATDADDTDAPDDDADDDGDGVDQ